MRRREFIAGLGARWLGRWRRGRKQGGVPVIGYLSVATRLDSRLLDGWRTIMIRLAGGVNAAP
jgi:hypothetical protein